MGSRFRFRYEASIQTVDLKIPLSRVCTGSDSLGECRKGQFTIFHATLGGRLTICREEIFDCGPNGEPTFLSSYEEIWSEAFSTVSWEVITLPFQRKLPAYNT